MGKASKSTARKSATPPTPGAMHSGDEMKYRAQDALHTLKRAHEIKNDPALMEHVKKHAATEREVLGKVMRRKT